MTLPNDWRQNRLCDHCDKLFVAVGVRQNHCSLACAFWSKVDIRGPEECWPWMARTRWKGYGKMTRNGTTFWAHRLAFESTGRQAGEMMVCHTCDNRACCNPVHLFLGDARANSDDKVAKGRQARGRQFPQTKLSEKDVRFIRQSPLSDTALARKYGVGRATIYNARNARSWAHLKLD